MTADISTFQPAHSPLFMAMRDPVLHQFISYLAQKKGEQERSPDTSVKIELSKEFIARVRESFKQSILDGERHLHILAQLLASHLLEGGFELHSNVIGVLSENRDRPFLIRERITQESLFSVTDIDLGNQMLNHFRYRSGDEWVPLKLSANFVEYLPLSESAMGVNRLTSRVKAEEELWNKVTDELFLLDELVIRDKHLHQYSKYIKDIFGIKIVCDNELTCVKVHKYIEDMDETMVDQDKYRMLSYFPKSADPQHSFGKLLKLLETKDYLTCDPAVMKKTGWKAIKSVAQWQGRLFEIQVQPLSNYYLELDHMAGPSHQSFKLKRDAMRDELARRIPLYGFYRDLLRMLFMGNEVSFEYANTSVVIA